MLQVGDLHIPSGLSTSVTVHQIHRNPLIWRDPEVGGVPCFAAADQAGTRAPVRPCTKSAAFLLHLHACLFLQAFDPSRFEKGGEASEHRCKYLPFGTGRRYCLGKYMAMAEMQVVVSHLIRKLTFEFVGTKENIAPSFRPPTMQPRDGMPMTVRDR